MGKRTKSSPYGTIDRPFNPLSLALGSEATFVARTVDVYPQHLKETIARAASHKGTSFVEIYQNCNIFNDGTFTEMTGRQVRNDAQVELVHGKPLIFGKNRDRGIRFVEDHLEIVRLGENGISESDLLVHDESRLRPSRAFQLCRMDHPGFPIPIGVFWAVERPTFDEEMNRQLERTMSEEGPGDLEELLNEGDIWEV
jgi:2-oxoglutarate ferredoxin oxidoreductase subunit beta